MINSHANYKKFPKESRDPHQERSIERWKTFSLFPLKFLSTLPIVFSNASVVGKHSKYASSFCMSDVTQSRVPQKNRPAKEQTEGNESIEWNSGNRIPPPLSFSARCVLFYRPVSRKSSTAGSPQGWRASTPSDIRHEKLEKNKRVNLKNFLKVFFSFLLLFFVPRSKKWRLIDSRSSYWYTIGKLRCDPNCTESTYVSFKLFWIFYRTIYLLS